MTKILFLDLDHTVRITKSGAKFINGNPYDQEIVFSAAMALSHFDDWHIIGISNQAGVAHEFKSLESTIIEQRYTLELCPQIKSIYICPDKKGYDCLAINRQTTFRYIYSGDSKQDKSYPLIRKGINLMLVEGLSNGYIEEGQYSYGSYRKPGTGMMVQALKDLGIDWRDNSNLTALMVGDMDSDFVSAIAMGIPFLWHDDWYQSDKLRIYEDPKLEICGTTKTERPYGIYGTIRQTLIPELLSETLVRTLLKYNHKSGAIKGIEVKNQPKIQRFSAQLSHWEKVLTTANDSDNPFWCEAKTELFKLKTRFLSCK